MIKAIETQYNGYRFRSRLEARWAVFFDTLGIRYEYEKEGFELPDGTRYLPDFWLPNEQVWVEIKGQEATVVERTKCALLADATGKPVALFVGEPGYELSSPYFEQYCHVWPTHSIETFYGFHVPPREVSHYDHMWANHFFEYEPDAPGAVGLVGHLKQHGFEPAPYTGTRESMKALIELDQLYYEQQYGKPHPRWLNGFAVPEHQLEFRENRIRFEAITDLSPYPSILRAYQAARSARFEFGETPAGRNRP
jgi:hypothetical protein